MSEKGSVKFGILKSGEDVVSVFPYDGKMAIVIKHKTQGARVVLVGPDSDGLPRIVSEIEILKGDDSIEVNSGSTTVFTF